MAFINIIGNTISSQRRKSGLPDTLLAKLLYLWTGKYDGDDLLNDLDTSVITVTAKDWATKYINSSSAATFAVPNNATYIDADGSDDFWFDGVDAPIEASLTQLISYDPQRTFIKYADFDPYHVYAIGILKTGEVLTDEEKNILSTYFKLHIFYFGVLNDYGYLKDNVGFEQRDTGP